MKKHYLFGDRQSFHGIDSQQLASLLLDLPPATLRRLREDLGITVEIEASPLHLSHDGRKIGIVSIPSKFGDISVAVAPKLESMRVRAILDELDDIDQRLPQFSIASRISSAEVEISHDNLSVGFLLALLRDIVSAAPLMKGFSTKRQRVHIRGGLRGRPLIEKSFTDMLLGRSLGFTCEVLSDKHLKEYEAVLLATGLSILETLGAWTTTLHQAGVTQEAMRAALVAAFKSLDTTNISFSDVVRICRPPFPFGLRDLLYRCLRYWRWRGNYVPSGSGVGIERFVSLSYNLDKLFEIYVGRAIERAAEGTLKRISNQSFPYVLDGIGTKPITPDQLFVRLDKSVLIIADAKYTDRVGEPEHVYQIVSYINYSYTSYPDAKVLGVLVYPGDFWQLAEIKGFNKQVYAVRTPVPVAAAMPALKDFLRSITVSAGN